MPLAFPYESPFYMGLLCGRAGRLTAENGGFGPGQYVVLTFVMVNYIAPVSKTWRMLGRERGRTWGIYCHSQMKLIEKAEAVAALRGRLRRGPSVILPPSFSFICRVTV